MAKKKRSKVPCIMYNDTDCRYPKGKRIDDQDELDTMINSKDGWNTGPVDAAKAAPKKTIAQMDLRELVAEAKKQKFRIPDNMRELDLRKALKK